jgi:GNAT superfamily N-acetyltransferase
VEVCATNDPRLDRLWERTRETVRVGAVRDAAFGAWRFGTRPDAGYRLLLAERAGRPAGYAVYRFLVFRGVPAAFLVDFLLAPEENEAGRALLQRVKRLAREDGAVLISALLPGHGPARRALRRSGYVRVPERLHPQVIRFSVRGFGPFAERCEFADGRSWFLSWADTDVV